FLGQSAAMPAGLADRLRIRRRIRRLDRRVWSDRLMAGRLVRAGEPIHLLRICRENGPLNPNLGLSCEHFWTASTTGHVSAPETLPTISIHTAFCNRGVIRDSRAGAVLLPNLGPVGHYGLDRLGCREIRGKPFGQSPPGSGSRSRA